MSIVQRIKILPISSGSAKGKVVYYNPNLPDNKYLNKIVVINDLDSSELIPTLKRAAGVIGEKGGITAHGAVLLREFKIPSILLPNAKNILKQGRLIYFSDRGYLDTQILKTKKIPRVENILHLKMTKKDGWVLTKERKPEDISSKFTGSFVKEGFLATPRELLNIKTPAQGKLTKKGFWIKNHPLPEEMEQKILKKPKWFKQKVKEQKNIFNELKKYEIKIKKRFDSNYKFSTEEAYQELLNCRDWFTKTRPYIFLFAYSIDVMEKDFYCLAVSFLPQHLATKLFDQISRSEYAKKIKELKIKRPRIPKTPKFPPSPLIFINTKPNYNHKIKLNKKIKNLFNKQPKYFQKKFKRYLEVFPIVTELNEEICYICRFFLTALTPRFLKIIAQEAIKVKLLKKEKDILNLILEEIENLVKKVEKINKTK